MTVTQTDTITQYPEQSNRLSDGVRAEVWPASLFIKCFTEQEQQIRHTLDRLAASDETVILICMKDS